MQRFAQKIASFYQLHQPGSTGQILEPTAECETEEAHDIGK